MGFLLASIIGLLGGAGARYLMPGPNSLGQFGAIGFGIFAALTGYTVSVFLGGTPLSVDIRGVLLAISACLIFILSYKSFALRYDAN